MSGFQSAPSNDGSDQNVAEIGGRGGRIASVLSALALAFSGLSFYESVLKTAALEVYVPPVIHYARDQGGDVELFAIPITIVNSGARTGTALTMELTVENLRADAPVKTKRYYSAFIGEHSPKDDEVNRAFAPLSLAGRATFSDTVRFYPEGNPLPVLVDDAGDYRFTLKLTTAVPAYPGILDGLLRREIPPIAFERTLPWISEQQLGMRRATIPMHDKNWQPTTTPATAEAAR
ncbi:hypothetical protein [Hyphomicrobium sp.]|uniref:hypothetical protein n=1 Tax=Hyphomicrobium sp. TaxID=82 RepID=UPI002E2F50FE|nr:hypothetical protein [Hyphomicrobium sp.]HEX2843227.1 hypothetical protein [Hyphomicrobium sp.]